MIKQGKTSEPETMMKKGVQDQHPSLDTRHLVVVWIHLKNKIDNKYLAGQWWCKPLIPALKRQSQEDL